MAFNITKITNILRLPRPCTLCKYYHHEKSGICNFCKGLLIKIENPCAVCAYPMLGSQQLMCGKCITKKPLFDQAFIPYLYEEPLRTILHWYKYYQFLYLKNFLADLLQQAIQSIPIADCIIPVPMHPNRLKERGFNHAAELAKSLSKKFCIPYQLNAIQKIYPSKPQATLNARLRKNNVFQTFSVKKINYKKILLIDDLLTTGNTLNEIARILKKSGVENIAILCCARAI